MIRWKYTNFITRRIGKDFFSKNRLLEEVFCATLGFNFTNILRTAFCARVYCDCWPDKHLNIFFKNVIYIVFYIDLFIVQIPSQNCWLPEDAFFIRWNILQENKHLNIYTVLVAVFCLLFFIIRTQSSCQYLFMLFGINDCKSCT